jgi:hypothetical protein
MNIIKFIVLEITNNCKKKFAFRVKMRERCVLLVVAALLVLATWADENGGSCGGKKGTAELCGVHEEELVDEKSKEW